jgi:hypothetical protein
MARKLWIRKITMDKMYRPEISGPKGKPVRNNPARLARLQARKERMIARGATGVIGPRIPSLKNVGIPGPMKPISNKEVNKIYRNQGF